MLLSPPLSFFPSQADTCHGHDFPVLSETNAQGLFVTLSFNRPNRERGERNLRCASVHPFYLTSLWCETAQYSEFEAAAFPDQRKTEYIKSRSVCRQGWNANISCPRNQIISVPSEPKREYIVNFFFFSPIHRYLPTATSTCVCKSPYSRCSDFYNFGICRFTQLTLEYFWNVEHENKGKKMLNYVLLFNCGTN